MKLKIQDDGCLETLPLVLSRMMFSIHVTALYENSF